MDTNAERDGNGWRINGAKTWNTGIHKAKHDLIFARTSGKAGDGGGITAFLVPTDADGFTKTFVASGKYAVWLRHTTPTTGEHAGKKYEEVKRYATLVVDRN